MRKLTIAATAIAASMLMAACTPADKKEEAAATEAAEAVPVEAVPDAVTPTPDASATKAADGAEAAPEGAEDKSAKGTEHTGGINVAPAQ